MSDNKPVIFISYSHKDEPDKPAEGEVQWLSLVRTYLQPAVKNGVFVLFDDQRLIGGAGLDPEIEKKLCTCDIFLLLISANSTASNYIVDTEIRITRERQSKGEDVRFYPLLLTPTPKIALDKLKDMVIRPKDAKPLSAFSYGERIQQMTDAADEIAAIAAEITNRKPSPPKRPSLPTFVHIAGLPETAYEHLVGRETELKFLDDVWADRNTNICSLIAEGGGGKSALVNEWLKRLQVENYRDADAVLGWSFYSQGSKERATSADQFLNWALDKLGIKIETASATAKGEAIAEAIVKRRVLLLLDGVEPLQHGLDRQHGELKDLGLRALLRRFASMVPAEVQGLVVLTSRLPIKDIARWKDSAAPILNVEKLSEEAGSVLLRDNGVWGTARELKAAAHDFGGHPLALGLLASFLKETQFGDVRRRDHIRAWTDDQDNPRHDHARRVMESYEKEWLAEQPILLAILHMVGLFDRPASVGCLGALRKRPAIRGLTDAIVGLNDRDWQRAVARLRDARLLAPPDSSTPDALDTHPLVREWFGDRLKQTNEAAWKSAHFVVYNYLRRTTREGEKPTLQELAPLYQAIAHGCSAGRYQEVLEKIYINRVCRPLPGKLDKYYASQMLGATGSNLAAMSWFFEHPYNKPIKTLSEPFRSLVISQAAFALRAQGRLSEALSVQQVRVAALTVETNAQAAMTAMLNLSDMELLNGEIDAARASAERGTKYAESSVDPNSFIFITSVHAGALHAAGLEDLANPMFMAAEKRQAQITPHHPTLTSVQGFHYCDLLLTSGNFHAALDRAQNGLNWLREQYPLLSIALDTLTIGRSRLGMALTNSSRQEYVDLSRKSLDEAVRQLYSADTRQFVPKAHLARSMFRRNIADWDGTKRDLDEVEEIAEPGPMKLFLCDMALERGRLAFAKIEAFAPLNGLMEDSPPKPVAPDSAAAARLKEEAAKQLAIAADYIKTCGYHRRDEELAELQAVLRGERKFADLPPRV